MMYRVEDWMASLVGYVLAGFEAIAWVVACAEDRLDQSRADDQQPLEQGSDLHIPACM